MWTSPQQGSFGGAPAGHAFDGTSEEPQTLPERVTYLEAKVQSGTGRPEDRLTLARSLAASGRWNDAVREFRHVLGTSAEDAQLLADYAEALAATQGRSLEGEPAKLIDRALALDPGNLKALFLASEQAKVDGDHRRAVVLLKRALAVVPPDSPDLAKYVSNQLENARIAAADQK